MAISLLTNLTALNAKRHLGDNSQALATAAERLASGRRINSAKDDVAGLSISYSLEARIRSIQQAQRNAQDALSMMQVTEGGMSEIGNMLIRLRELAIQAASDSISDREREMLEVEAHQLKEEINRIAESTKYLGTHLLNGSGKDFTFQVGPDNDEFNRLHFSTSIVDLRTSSLGISGVDLGSPDAAVDSLESIDEGITRLHHPMAQVGAVQSRIHSTLGNLATYEESLTAANSRIRDADLATETTRYVQAQIQQRAATAILAQANLLPMLAYKLIES